MKTTKYLPVILMGILLLTTQCSPDNKYIGIKDPEVKSMLKSIKSSEDSSKLIALILQKVTESPKDEQRNLLLELGFDYSQNFIDGNNLFGMELLKSNFKSEKSPEILWKLSQNLKIQNKVDLATIMVHSLKLNFKDNRISNLPSDDNWNMITADWIKGKGLLIFDSVDTTKLSETNAQRYVDICEAYAITHQSDPLSADLLYQAAEIARSLNTIEKSVALYDNLIYLFPDHSEIPNAMFIKGFLLENNLGLKEIAKETYNLFLTRYPNHDRAKDVNFLLENLNVPDADLLKNVQK
jgi:tetratricopeptide (TPR) repeat protein